MERQNSMNNDDKMRGEKRESDKDKEKKEEERERI